MSRIRANQITNQSADGAPTVQHGLIVSGVTTVTGSINNLNLTGITTISTLDLNGDLDVDGHTNLDNVNIAGVTTTSGDVTIGSGGENSALGVRFNSAYAQIKLPDGQTGANRKGNLSFGDSDDFRIVFDGHHTYIRADSGDIYITHGSANPVNIYNNRVDVNVDLTLTDTTADSAAGPEFKLFRNSASPADADYLGQIKFAGESDTGVERNYAKITGKILDASNGTEDGILEFAHIKAGSQTITGRWRSDSLQLLNGTALTVAGSTTVTGNIIPSSDSATDIGTNSVRFANLYADTLYGDGSNLTGISGGVTSDAQQNTVGGTNAGDSFSGTNAEKNTLFGYDAGTAINSGDNNTAFGYNSLSSCTTGYDNISLGWGSATQLVGAHNNVIVGRSAATGLTNNGNHNVVLGNFALRGGDASQNTAIGDQCLKDAATNCIRNTGVGMLAGENVTTGAANVFVGFKAGDQITTGGNNTIIGNEAAASSATISNEITLGNTSITKFRIPGINVTLKDNGGTPTQGHVLTVDGNGEAGFAAASGTTINNNSDNRIITGSSSANTLNAETNITSDGNNITVNRASGSSRGYYLTHGGAACGHLATHGSGPEGLLELKNNGNAGVGIYGDSGRIILYGSSQYINFGSTVNSSNQLDDYEQGSYTITSNANLTLDNTRTGYYTKVGNMVTVTGYLSLSTNNGSPSVSGSDNIVLSLPYAVNTSTGTYTGTMLQQNIDTDTPTSIGHPLYYRVLPVDIVCMGGSDGLRFYINHMELAYTRMNNSHLHVGYPGYTYIAWNITYRTN